MNLREELLKIRKEMQKEKTKMSNAYCKIMKVEDKTIIITWTGCGEWDLKVTEHPIDLPTARLFEPDVTEIPFDLTNHDCIEIIEESKDTVFFEGVFKPALKKQVEFINELLNPYSYVLVKTNGNACGTNEEWVFRIKEDPEVFIEDFDYEEFIVENASYYDDSFMWNSDIDYPYDEDDEDYDEDEYEEARQEAEDYWKESYECTAREISKEEIEEYGYTVQDW